MKILEYEYHGCADDDWKFNSVIFGKTNLIVGMSGSGKTRLLNTIFNLGTFVAQGNFKKGCWQIIIEHEGHKYDIKIDTIVDELGQFKAIQENIIEIDKDGCKKKIIERDDNNFHFNGDSLPKLPKDQSSIFLLKDEDLIEPIHSGFSSIVRRDFSYGSLRDLTAPGIVDELMHEKTKLKKFKDAFIAPDTLNVQLYILEKCFNNVYSEICEIYKSVFPFIQSCKIMDLKDLPQAKKAPPGFIPIFCIKEKNSNKWLPLHELSNGMQKVLLLTSDLLSLSSKNVYLIDEYENSLGLNAIDCLPTYLLESTNVNQFIITSHHPYIINNIPMENWYIMHRSGTAVEILYGDKIVERFGKSKQQAFIKLINDKFYTEGIE